MSSYIPEPLEAVEWGRERLLIDDTDVTYLRGVPAIIESWRHQDPFGYASLTVHFPQMTPFEGLGSGPLAFARKGANVDLQLVSAAGVVRQRPIFEGFVSRVAPYAGETSLGVTIECLGFLYQADYQQNTPEVWSRLGMPSDVAQRIAYLFNHTVGRRFTQIPNTTTGIASRKTGAASQSRLAFIGEELATARTTSGQHLTCLDTGQPGRRARLAWRDMTTHHYTVSLGAQGVTVDVADDLTEDVNVILGSGTAPGGGAWSNMKYPHYHPDATPDYPLGTGVTFHPGDSHTGFAPWATRAREQGYAMRSGDTYLAVDEDDVRDFQTRAGITVDGIVGPQTWNALFQPGSNIGDLNGAFRMPLAYRPEVEPYLYNAQGGIIGANPAYDPDVLRVEKWEEFGDGVTKAEGIASAKKELAAIGDHGLVGTITLRTDPEQCHRFDMRAGRNIFVRYYKGTAGQLFHIVGAEVQRQDHATVLTVTEKPIDYMTAVAIMKRIQDAKDDPARRIIRKAAQSSRITEDRGIVFDAESGAGIVPEHSLFGGLWTVIPIPFGSWGQIARMDIRTKDDPSEFYIGLFDRDITENRLATLVGNPGSGAKPWDTQYDALRAAGLLMAWGGKDTPLGYFPLSKGDDGASLTGRFEDDLSFDFASTRPPWLWLAEYSPDSCRISGRFYVAPPTLG